MSYRPPPRDEPYDRRGPLPPSSSLPPLPPRDWERDRDRERDLDRRRGPEYYSSSAWGREQERDRDRDRDWDRGRGGDRERSRSRERLVGRGPPPPMATPLDSYRAPSYAGSARTLSPRPGERERGGLMLNGVGGGVGSQAPPPISGAASSSGRSVGRTSPPLRRALSPGEYDRERDRDRERGLPLRDYDRDRYASSYHHQGPPPALNGHEGYERGSSYGDSYYRERDRDRGRESERERLPVGDYDRRGYGDGYDRRPYPEDYRYLPRDDARDYRKPPQLLHPRTSLNLTS